MLYDITQTELLQTITHQKKFHSKMVNIELLKKHGLVSVQAHATPKKEVMKKLNTKPGKETGRQGNRETERQRERQR